MESRYQRQALFKEIGDHGQKKIRQKHIGIVGCGALGSQSADMLSRAGIGKLTLIDRDYVELTNLQRQQLYTEEDVEKQLPKAVACKNHLEKINHEVDVDAIVLDLTADNITSSLKNVDLIIDATDNFDTRFLINDFAQKHKIPWIFGACVGSAGMSFTFIPDQTPCLDCLIKTAPMYGATCDSVGIISPAVQMVVANQVSEALKWLVEAKEKMRSTFITFDLWQNTYYSMNVTKAKSEECPSCGEQPVYPHLQFKNHPKSEILCGRNTVQIRRQTANISLEELAKHVASFGKVTTNPFLVSVDMDPYRIVFFRDGRTFIHGTNSIDKAKSLYYKMIG
ncbi:MoeB/ThiF family adenylyltransferase [Saliterribacillus persicus]|uniref:Adenylyltransferase/sulfurtransferase n=1 Tax=Saliterribacillus persicus TaxID=930114 RepID=A0A368XKD9_9BACI|nr:MoeB/ThiF family adenylyltransferase [Saliterribacillus persicus]RCW66957.1 adenylyltransferase/sulfurtransferase [Saliterribacillus persicus]